MTTSTIRKAFIDYFLSKNHQLISSSSLVPASDATLLFTNAGMVQFKNIFLGKEKYKYPRVVSAQCCLRAGGKHNDLENVGYTARHHTFFEMLGNFSFGDYFKREAIHYAWEFLTSTLQLPVERLWITVYKDDEAAADIWLKEIGISAARFSRCDEKNNFWTMGETGPCGPCTEIFYDHGPEIYGGPPGSATEDGDRYVEIWNLVFMQFNRDKAGHLSTLPKPSVDTGMGLERIAAVVQGVHDNYDIDSFQHIIQSIVALTPNIKHKNNASLKVIADHIRACVFLIADGVLPNNEGRGYVLRRIIRRAVRHGNKLALSIPFLNKLVKSVIDVMGDAYPQIIQQQLQIEQVLVNEENQFLRTLEQGLKLLDGFIQNLSSKIIPGDIAFKLYDTYGFPLDLTNDIAKEQGLSVDVNSFTQCMQQQRQLSQMSSQFNIDYALPVELAESSVFHGYDTDNLTSKILAILTNEKKMQELSTTANAAIILDVTPFYAESGGQVGDQGEIFSEEALFKVIDTQQSDKAIIHYGQLLYGTLKVNQTVKAVINTARRQSIRLNHTATHLLHAALKIVLGQHVQQKGSLVDADRCRFDFAHFTALTPSQIQQTEEIVNEKIRANEKVITEYMDLNAAKKSGAIALFNEKYSATVRVLSISDFSKELCGGTHVAQTGDIGLFKIISDSAIANGIRRIEFLTGCYALEWVNKQLDNLEAIASILKTSVPHVPVKLSQFLHEIKQQEQKVIELQTKLQVITSAELLAQVENIQGVNLLIKQLDNSSTINLRPMLDYLRSKLDNAIIVLFIIGDNKIHAVASISKNLLGKVPTAVEFIKYLCEKGGGRADMAQGGGSVPKDLQERISQIKSMIKHAV